MYWKLFTRFKNAGKAGMKFNRYKEITAPAINRFLMIYG